jgi:hypothetical protein
VTWHRTGEAAWAARDTMLRDLLVDSPWRAFRSEPRYQALLAALGLNRPARSAA